MKNQRLRILVVEDQEMFSTFLVQWLSARGEQLRERLLSAGFSSTCCPPQITTADSLREAYSTTDQNVPDLVITDLNLGDGSGLQLAAHLRTRYRTTRLIAMSALPDEWTTHQIEHMRFDGFITKSRVGLNELITTIVGVLSGKTAFASDYQAYRRRCLSATSAITKMLTPREAQAFEVFAWGYDDQEAGELLGISPLTVRKHRQHLMEKLKVQSTAKLVAQAWRCGFGRTSSRPEPRPQDKTKHLGSRDSFDS